QLIFEKGLVTSCKDKLFTKNEVSNKVKVSIKDKAFDKNKDLKAMLYNLDKSCYFE
ncbi:20562_t:CDS:1, partial [Gigaspora margarita]